MPAARKLGLGDGGAGKPMAHALSDAAHIHALMDFDVRPDVNAVGLRRLGHVPDVGLNISRSTTMHGVGAHLGHVAEVAAAMRLQTPRRESGRTALSRSQNSHCSAGIRKWRRDVILFSFPHLLPIAMRGPSFAKIDSLNKILIALLL